MINLFGNLRGVNPILSEMKESSYRQKFKLSVALAVALVLLTTADSFAQRRFAQTYPARRNVQIHLINRTGKVEVIASNRDNIRVTALMESSSTRCVPNVTDDGIEINVIRDNTGREDVGDVDFRIEVPVNSSVDIETKRGDIIVRGVQGTLVRAHVSTEGDIELTGIHAAVVRASNTMGNILFDGELMPNGKYELSSMQGDINIRIPVNSGFRLIAVAREGRNIDLGIFRSMGNFDAAGDSNKRVVGQVGDGGASFLMTNHRGVIRLSPR